MNKSFLTWCLLSTCIFSSCDLKVRREDKSRGANGKIVIYQVFTRLWGNTNTTNKPWGTSQENGIGKFADFTDAALDSIRELGITHIWYTGVPHHAVVADYSSIGITADDPDVVKGRAGSPYAVKDYYNVNPDLATDPAKRLEEFEALVARTHRHGLKVIIDIVPNHVARSYKSITKPDSVSDFGANDNTKVEYERDNSFYYIPGKAFEVPVSQNNYRPLGGEAHLLSDGKFEENPAKWTGNGSRLAQPRSDDWYETVKINYGVRADGTKDFDTIPAAVALQDVNAHYSFWQNKTVPASWKKFRDIALFWLGKGVDGFRFDMAEMVPVEFWSYMNSAIKHANPAALLLAEVYNPAEYRNYINIGKMDYLYDKVELYDTLKHIIQGSGSTDHLTTIFEGQKDIAPHLLHFLENHDEQRIASPEFAGDAQKALPALVLSALATTSPMLIYFGQEVGEPGAENAGFGKPSRTSIFDYVGVPYHQRWLNNGKYDGGKLSAGEKALRSYYQQLLNYALVEDALSGEFYSLHEYNREKQPGYTDKLYSFARYTDNRRIVVVCNFSSATAYKGKIQMPPELIEQWGMNERSPRIIRRQPGEDGLGISVGVEKNIIEVELQPLESAIFEIE